MFQNQNQNQNQEKDISQSTTSASEQDPLLLNTKGGNGKNRKKQKQNIPSTINTSDNLGAGQEMKLIQMIEQGNLNAVNSLLTQPGLDVNQVIIRQKLVLFRGQFFQFSASFVEISQTPLLCAVQRGLPEITLALLRRGADPRIQGEVVFTPGELPSRSGFACTPYQTSFGMKGSPLACALLLGQNLVALQFIEAGANVNEQCEVPRYLSSENSALIPVLHLAIKYCNKEVVQAMLNKGADKNAQGKHVYGKLVDCFCFLFLYGPANLAARTLTCCCCFEYFCSHDLLPGFAWLTSTNYTATELAAHLGQDEIHDLLNKHTLASPPLLLSQASQPSSNSSVNHTMNNTMSNTNLMGANTNGVFVSKTMS